MTMRKLALEAMYIVAILFGVVPLGSSNAALAQQSAVAPKNLRVTGGTDWTVALMWDAPKGKATEAMVFWGNSTDNVTPQEHIRSYLCLNGQFDGATVDPSRTSSPCT